MKTFWTLSITVLLIVNIGLSVLILRSYVTLVDTTIEIWQTVSRVSSRADSIMLDVDAVKDTLSRMSRWVSP